MSHPTATTDKDIIAPPEHLEHTEGDDTIKGTDADLVLAYDTGLIGVSRWGALRRFWWPSLLCVMACLGVMNDGYQNQMPGSIISNQGFINQFGTVVSTSGEVSLSASAVSLWGGMMPTGQMVGAAFAGWFNDRVGRRGGMYVFTVCYLVGTILEITARNVGGWAGAKVIFGFAQGMTTATAPIYIGELAPPQIRGTLLCLYGFLFAIGQLVASVVLYVIQNTRPLDYKLAIYTEFAFHGIWIFGGLLWLPESPWYHARQNNDDKARHSLNRIYGGIEGYDVEHELVAIKHEIERQAAAASAVGAWTDLFKGTNTRRTLAACFAIDMQMLSGVIVMFAYTTYFVQQAGIGEPFTASLIVTIILLVGLLVSFYAVEVLGRRALMIGGGVACAVCNLVIGITGCLPKNDSTNHAALAFVFLWVFSYAASFAGVGWGMVSECATPRLKSKTAAAANITYNAYSLLFFFTVPYMLASSGAGAVNWGTKALFLFAGTSIVGTAVNYFLLPETRGRTQSELDEMYERGVPPRQMSAYRSELEQTGGKGY